MKSFRPTDELSLDWDSSSASPSKRFAAMSARTADHFSFKLSVCIPLSGVDKGFTVGVSLRRPKKAGSSD